MKIKSLKLITIIIVAASLASCGSKKSSKSNSSNGYVDNQGNTYNSQQESNIVQSVKSNLACKTGPRSYMSTVNGGPRLTRDYVYSMPYRGNQTNICGTPTPGAMSGSTGQVYIGVSAFNDVMAVTEIVNGSQVIGYNIRISMCGEYLNSQFGQLPLIGDQRALSGFRMPNGCMVIDKNSDCSHGVVDAAFNTQQVSAPYQYTSNGVTGQLGAYQVITTFGPVQCRQ